MKIRKGDRLQLKKDPSVYGIEWYKYQGFEPGRVYTVSYLASVGGSMSWDISPQEGAKDVVLYFEEIDGLGHSLDFEDAWETNLKEILK